MDAGRKDPFLNPLDALPIRPDVGTAATAGRFTRSKWQCRRKDAEKDPRGEDEKEHGYLVVSGRPIPSLLETLLEYG